MPEDYKLVYTGSRVESLYLEEILEENGIIAMRRDSLSASVMAGWADGSPEDAKGEATWVFNLGRRSLLADDDGSRWIGGEEKQVRHILSPTVLTLYSPVSSNKTSVSLVKTGLSDVWNDRYLKKYGTALIKYQWGSNLSKFAGIQMPGGVTLDGPRIMQEAKEEMDKLEEDMYNFNSLPSEIFTG